MTPGWLRQLAPAHAPPPPSGWPPAPGWWLLSALAAASALAAWWWWRVPHRQARRTAMRELRRIGAEHDDVRTSARAIESLLRRYAMAVFGGERVARLAGRAWLEFVAAEGGAELAGESGRSLLAAAFGSAMQDDRHRWLTGADAFVRLAGRRAGKR